MQNRATVIVHAIAGDHSLAGWTGRDGNGVTVTGRGHFLAWASLLFAYFLRHQETGGQDHTEKNQKSYFSKGSYHADLTSKGFAICWTNEQKKPGNYMNGHWKLHSASPSSS